MRPCVPRPAPRTSVLEQTPGQVAGVGEVFARRYELLDPIADGGMGSVWLVRDLTEGDVKVAKLLGTHFYQSPWVLYGQVDDPRRVPSLADVGCTPEGDLELADQPGDMTVYGSRVVDGVSIAAVALLSHSGDHAAVTCSEAADHAPLWLMPSSVAEPFTATGIAILGALLLVAGALVHPATDELPARWRAGRRRRGGD